MRTRIAATFTLLCTLALAACERHATEPERQAAGGVTTQSAMAAASAALPTCGSIIDLTAKGASCMDATGAILAQTSLENQSSSGTGLFESFVRIQKDGVEQGYNTSGRPLQFDENSSPTFTHDLPLNAVPIVTVDGKTYREFRLDINQNNSTPASALLSLDRVRLFTSTRAGLAKNSNPQPNPDDDRFGQGSDTRLVWQLPAGTWAKLNYALESGSGWPDAKLLVPDELFGDASAQCPYDAGSGSPCGIYIYLYSKFGVNHPANAGFEEWSVRKLPYVTVTKTAATSFTREITWDIQKKVAPAAWHLFDGETGTSKYTVTVTKSGSTDKDFAVSGTITITNPSKDGSVTVTSVTDAIVGEGTAIAVSCPQAVPFTIDAKKSVTCSYQSSLASGDTRTNRATVVLESGGAYSGTAQVVFDMSKPTSVVNGTITVTDSYKGDLGSFSDTKSVTYDRTFACSADKGEQDNIATIVETDQKSSAKVNVSCYAPTVTKTATPAKDRKYFWTVAKKADVSSLTLSTGQTYQVGYTVTAGLDANKPFEDSNWQVSGTITISNPNPNRDAVLNSVQDAISGFAGNVTVACTLTDGKIIVPKGKSASCSYSATLDNGDNRTNTATVAQQLYSYDSDGKATATEAKSYASAGVPFGFADDKSIKNTVDKCADVTDDKYGSLGNVCANQVPMPRVFTYTMTVGAYATCGTYQVDNTASITAVDTKSRKDARVSVPVNVPCLGCTLTQGYWKTHSEYGKAPYDATWKLVLDADDLTKGITKGADKPFLSQASKKGQTWYEVFWTAPKGDPYRQLATQWMAAYLNTLGSDGVTPTGTVATALTEGRKLLELYAPGQVPSDMKKAFSDYHSTLAQFNEGKLGPGHCSEDKTSATD